MITYWISLMIKYHEGEQPQLCALSECEMSFEDAKKVIEKMRKLYNVTSAWVDCKWKDKNGNIMTKRIADVEFSSVIFAMIEKRCSTSVSYQKTSSLNHILI